jgi:2-haloacid dehalogenase
VQTGSALAGDVLASSSNQHRRQGMRLSDYAVLTFDCYGTLIDWETGISEALAPWLVRAGVSLERDQVLEAFAQLESAQQAATPSMRYPELLAEVHRGLAERFGIAPDAGAAAAFGASVGNWPAFADSAEALAHLGQHYQLAILSNVDRASFARSNARLGVRFDAIYTAEDIGSYKPDPRNFDYLLRHLAERGIAKAQILHTAESLYHDHIPASGMGLATCWIHRRAGKQGHGATSVPGSEIQPDFRFESLAAMAAAHRAERGA